MLLTEAVQALGGTPESVTAKLREMGIKGYRQLASSCPIARYFNACGFPRVTVSAYVNVYRDRDSESYDQTMLLPVWVRDWICNFDDGKYPEFYLE